MVTFQSFVVTLPLQHLLYLITYNGKQRKSKEKYCIGGPPSTHEIRDGCNAIKSDLI